MATVSGVLEVTGGTGTGTIEFFPGADNYGNQPINSTLTAAKDQPWRPFAFIPRFGANRRRGNYR
jgi:hypothetical protein